MHGAGRQPRRDILQRPDEPGQDHPGQGRGHQLLAGAGEVQQLLVDIRKIHEVPELGGGGT